jgi:hypothetical protein
MLVFLMDVLGKKGGVSAGVFCELGPGLFVAGGILLGRLLHLPDILASFGVLDEHDAGIRHIDPDFNDGRRNQDLHLAVTRFDSLDL